MDIQIVIAGSAGEGIQTIGNLLAKVIQARGYSVFTWQEVESRIRGGQGSYRLRISDTPENAPRDNADILLSMNPAANLKYLPLLRDQGIWLSETPDASGEMITIAFQKIAREDFGKAIYANTVALGAVCGILGIDISALNKVMEKAFADKTERVVRTNLQAAEKGYALAKDTCGGKCAWQLPQKTDTVYLMPGLEALALAAAYAGCRFISAYPMSPSTGIITFLSAKEADLGVFAEQAEDEIAAINMAIGAGFAGARAMTATSGGGFSLMVEGISLAGMTETPVVVVLAQRPGPATGLPTRTAQGDLLFAIHAGHGEFPKLVLAPSDPEDAFQKTVKGFNLAEKYQIPVIIMIDQFLADAQFSYNTFDFNKIPPESHREDPAGMGPYKRYLFTPGGVSPRLYPGQGAHLVSADSDEHDEYGHITEDIGGVAERMFTKRLKKMEGLTAEILPPEQKDVTSAETVLVGWGSTRGAILESLELLRNENKKVGMIHFTELWPLPEFSFPSGKKYVSVETNATGQLECLLKAHYGLAMNGNIRKWDGLPICAEYIREKVLTHGN
jgi:2-oxoglutarate ferredoxin oxidoreductase subunit alpha